MFTLFQNFADLCLKYYPFFLISRIRAYLWKITPFFAKVGTSVVYVLSESGGGGGYYPMLNDPGDLLHCQWFKWLMHMILELPRILTFRITGPLWGVHRNTEQAIEQTIELPMISFAMSL